ncbi:hypothetical protein HY500_02815 [Candidatus Woesearchaeota archaeon]|nr:hypothetical protein [Candidatus Woesearchaeota archaeon]
MTIVGFNYEKLSVEKKEEEVKKGSDFKVTYNVSIKDMQDYELKLQDKQKALKFLFEFSIKYTPQIGSLDMGGSIIYTEDKNKVKEIKEYWDEKKDVPDDIKAQLINLIFRRSNIKALLLTQEVNLPSHIPMPKIVPPSVNPQDYIG